MNNQIRKELKTLSAKIAQLNEELSGVKFQANELADELQNIIDVEQEAYDGLSDNAQSGKRGQAIEQAIEAMQEAFRALEYVYDVNDLDDAIEALEQAQA